jgi:hypothetical protein
MHSKEKFFKLLTVGGPGNLIWLDAVSIDQFDDEDVKKQVGSMGTIYGNAESVPVLLPVGDEDAWKILHDLAVCAKVILRGMDRFAKNEDALCTEGFKGFTYSKVCQYFHKLMADFETNMPR